MRAFGWLVGIGLSLMAVAPAWGQPSAGSAPTLEHVRGDLYVVRDSVRTTVVLATVDGILVCAPLGSQTATWLRSELASQFPGRRLRYVVRTGADPARDDGTAVLTASRTSDQPEVIRNFDYFTELVLAGERIRVIETRQMRDLTIVAFSQQRALFTTQFPGPPGARAFGDLSVTDAQTYVGLLKDQDFDLIIAADGTQHTRGELDRLSEYIDALRARIVRGLREGQTTLSLEGSSLLDDFQDTPYWPRRRAHIAEVAAGLRVVTTDIYVAGLLSLSALPSARCDESTACAFVRRFDAAAVGLQIRGGNYGVTVQARAGGQWESRRTQALYRDEYFHRDSALDFLVTRDLTLPIARSATLGAGASVLFANARGERVVQKADTRVNGRRMAEDGHWSTGVTGAVEFRRTFKGLTVHVPVAATVNLTPADYLEGRWHLHAGIGVTAVRFRRTVGRH